MSRDIVISISNLCKSYRMWVNPASRMTTPLLEGLSGLLPSSLGTSQWLRHRATKNYREFRALHNITMSVSRGEAVGIIGRNGSGKSTLLQLIAGTLQPTTGHVKANGRVAALLELGSGFNQEFTGRENVFLNGAILGFSQSEMESRMEDIETFADIGRFIEHPVKTYSTGMMLRLAFAVQIQVNPEILIVDEALSVGDEAFSRKCLAKIEQLREAGTSLLLVSHAAQTILQICNRVVMLNNGEMILDGKPKPIVHFYQKFISSSPEIQEQMLINKEIIVRETTTSDNMCSTTHERESINISEFFSDDLKTESAVSYEERGARIWNCRITNSTGRRINNLVTGKRYTFSYNVTFDVNHEDVAFGMMITSINGVEIGGGSTWDHTDELRSFSAGSSITVAFDFDCKLPAGSYFLRCGIANKQFGFIHRHLDIIQFKVIVPKRKLQSGLVDFNPTLTISPTSST